MSVATPRNSSTGSGFRLSVCFSSFSTVPREDPPSPPHCLSGKRVLGTSWHRTIRVTLPNIYFLHRGTRITLKFHWKKPPPSPIIRRLNTTKTRDELEWNVERLRVCLGTKKKQKKKEHFTMCPSSSISGQLTVLLNLAPPRRG